MGCGVIMTVLQNRQLIKQQQNMIKTSKSNVTRTQIQNGNLSLASLVQEKQNRDFLPQTQIISKQSIRKSINQQKASKRQGENIVIQKQPINEKEKKQSDKLKETKQQFSNEVIVKPNNSQIKQTKKQIDQITNKIEIQEPKREQKNIQSQKPQSMKVQIIQTSPTLKGKSPLQTSARNLNKRSSKNLNKNDISRKSLKVKKEMVHVDSLYLQSVITKPQQPQLQMSPRQISTVRPYSKEETSMQSLSRKGKNQHIQIVDKIVQINKNLETHKMINKEKQSTPISKARQPSKQQKGRKKSDQQKNNVQKKKEDQKKMQFSRKKMEDQKKKAEQMRVAIQTKKRSQEQQKKNIEMQTNKLKKVYDL